MLYLEMLTQIGQLQDWMSENEAAGRHGIAAVQREAVETLVVAASIVQLVESGQEPS